MCWTWPRGALFNQTKEYISSEILGYNVCLLLEGLGLPSGKLLGVSVSISLTAPKYVSHGPQNAVLSKLSTNLASGILIGLRACGIFTVALIKLY